MGKYIIVVILGIAFILGAIWLLDITKSKTSNTIGQAESSTSSTTQALKLVTVSPDDDHYHVAGCVWVGHEPREVTLKTALESGYVPCPYCIKSDSQTSTDTQSTAEPE